MIFDIIVLVAVVLSSIVAFLRGFIREVLTILGVVGGLAASYFGGPILIPVMRGWLGVKEVAGDAAKDEEVQKLFDIVPMTLVADACAYGLIFIVVVVILTVLSHFLAAGVKAIGLGPVDRILGVLFGVGRAVLLLALAYLPVYLLSSKEQLNDWFEGSRTRPYIESTSEWINGFLPKTEESKDDEKAKPSLGKTLDEKMDELGQKYEDMDAMKKTADKANEILDSAKEKIGDAASDLSNDVDGYKQEQRESLDQLIETNQTQQGAQ